MPRKRTEKPSANAAPPGKAPLRISPMALAMAQSRPAAKPRSPWTIPTPAPGVAPKDAKVAMDEAFNGLYNYAGNSYGGTYSGEGLYFLGYPVLSEMAQRSEYRRLVGTLAQEMTRRFIRLTSTGNEDKADRIQKLDTAMKRFRVRDVFREAAEQDGFFGIGHIYIDTGVSDDPDELKTPLMAKSAKIKKGGLKRIRTIEPLWCYPGAYNSNQPLDADFYRPKSWYVMSREIDRTRLLSLVSREVPDILKPAFMFGGLSLTQLAQPTVDNWLRTRQSVNNLIHSFTVWRLSTDLSATLNGGGGEEMAERAALFNQYRDNTGLMMINKETEEFGNVSASLAGLDSLQSQAQEHMAAIDGMPLIKLVGYTPLGLNSTGEGEMDSWRDRVKAQQEHLFNEPLKQILDIIQLSEFGDIDEDIGFEWEPLEDPNEAERAVVRKTDIDAAVELIAAGVISPEEERERLAKMEESLYHGLDVEDVPDPPEDDDAKIMPDPAKGAAKAADSWLVADEIEC